MKIILSGERAGAKKINLKLKSNFRVICILSVISFFDILDYLSEGACVKQSNGKLTVYTETNSISR